MTPIMKPCGKCHFLSGFQDILCLKKSMTLLSPAMFLLLCLMRKSNSIVECRGMEAKESPTIARRFGNSVRFLRGEVTWL